MAATRRSINMRMLYFDVPAFYSRSVSGFSRSFAIAAAEVAELADALASGASGRKAIGVRVPASAPLDGSMAAHAAALVAGRDQRLHRCGTTRSRVGTILLKESALERERQLKPWSAQKKAALVRGDLDNT